MSTYFVDTNIFLRTLIKEDEDIFQECVEFLQAIKQNKINGATSTIVLAELAWTLSSYYKFTKNKIIIALDSILKLSGLKIVDGYDMYIALKSYKNKNVKFIDAVISSIHTIQGKIWVVVSYDKDFDKLYILRQEPKDVLTKIQKSS